MSLFFDLWLRRFSLANPHLIFRLDQLKDNFGPNQSVLGLALFMGGLVQIIVAVMEFSVGNTFGMTTHGSYGAFWLSYAMFLIPSLGIQGAYSGDTRAYSFSMGIYLITWCLVTTVFLIASLKTNLATVLLYVFLFLSYLFLSIANFILTMNPVVSVALYKAGGVFSVICATFAFYLGSSALVSRETSYWELPLGTMKIHEGY
jgi:succinate-acetate transporter protein